MDHASSDASIRTSIEPAPVTSGYITLFMTRQPLRTRSIVYCMDLGCEGLGVKMAAGASVFLLMCNGQIETLEVLRLFVMFCSDEFTVFEPFWISGVDGSVHCR